MKKAVIFISVLLCAVWASADEGDIRFSISTERTTISKGEQITLVATLSSPEGIGSASAPTPSPSDDFDLMNVRRSQSHSSHAQIVGNKIVKKREVRDQFIYTITPQKKGTFTFPALEVTLGGKTYRTKPIRFSVKDKPVENPDVRAYLLMNKKSLYSGEQAILTFKVAQKVNSPVQTQRGYSGAIERIEKAFGKEFSLDRLFSRKIATDQERINGELHHTFSLRFSLFGITPGEYHIPAIPFEYDKISETRRRGADPFFGDFFDMDFFGGTEAVRRTVYTPPLTVTIKPLPSAPPDFSGSVGKFTVDAKVNPSSVPAGESFTLRITLKGNSKSTNLGDPVLPELENCDVFTPERHTRTDTTSSGLYSKKTYRYLIIPQKEGEVSPGPVAYSYFDPSSGTFKTAKSDDLQVSVSQGTGSTREQTRTLTQEEIQQVGEDIRYIRTESDLNHQPPRPYREPHWYLLFPLPFLLWIAAFIYKVQSRSSRQNAHKNIRQKALRLAMKELEKLKNNSNVSDHDFLGKVAVTMEKYISHKFGFAATGRTLEELKSELLSRKIDEETVTGLTQLIENIDEYRFGGKQFKEEGRKGLILQASKFLTSMEKKIQKQKQKPSLSTSVIVLLCSAVLYPVLCSPIENWFEKANSFYAESNYDSAQIYYSKIIEEGINNSDVLFNLGNTYFRQDKPGLARLYYEKAAEVSPKDPDIQANIRFVKSSIVDRVKGSNEAEFLTTVLYNVHTLFSLNQQLYIFFILLLATSILLSLMLFRSGMSRMWIIYAVTLCSLVLVVTGLSAGYKIFTLENKQYAIILTPSLDAKNQPQGDQILFTAHEGTKLRIRKTVGDWSLVSLPNGASGWVKDVSLGKI
ncbi:MAG: BatD family protein [Chitinispirillaceae bacterium]